MRYFYACHLKSKLTLRPPTTNTLIVFKWPLPAKTNFLAANLLAFGELPSRRYYLSLVTLLLLATN